MMKILKRHVDLLCLVSVLLFMCCSGDKGEQVITVPTETKPNPQVRSASPGKAPEGAVVMLSGANFGSDPAVIVVTFDGVHAEVVTVTDSKLEVLVPAKGEKESVRIRVSVEGRLSNQYQFEYDFHAPSIMSLSHTEAAEGDRIEIKGEYFGSNVEDFLVFFGGRAAEILSFSNTSVEVVVPEYGGRQTVGVKVKVKQKESEEVAFTYTAFTNITYRNPVVNSSLPDPTLIKGQDGYFYLYATEDVRNMPIMKSNNLITWASVGTAFTNATRPTFEPNGGLWAPDINYINGQYVMYYSMSVWGGEWTCGIGVATADKPEGPFTDRGKLFRSNEIDVQNSIDPCFVEDGGKKYLMWGSFRGIYMIEMNDDGLSVKSGAVKQQVAGTYFEGVYIYKRNDYYYMFASIGSCCNGLSSTYQLVVGRSTSLAGPYVNRSGNRMMNNAYTLVINKNTAFVGNGHCSQIVQDDKGTDWILYHGIRTDNPSGRVLMLDRIRWDDQGWPYITGGTPSLEAPAPVF